MTREDADEYDVVVVGSGGAGLTAAVAASTRGLSVLVLEKTATYGGSTALSGGVLWIPANQLLDRLDVNWFLPGVGLADSIDKGREYLQQTVGDRIPVARREAFLRAGPAMITELIEKAGVRLRHMPFPDYYAELPGGTTVGRSIEADVFDGRKLGADLDLMRPPSPAVSVKGVTVTGKEGLGMTFGFAGSRALRCGATVIGRLLRARLTGAKPLACGQSLVGQLRHVLKQRGVPLWLDTHLLDLLADDGSGVDPRVDGVRVRRNGRTIAVRARCGVILATGGFAGSQELREKYLPHPTDTSWSLAPGDGQEGDTVGLGLAVGAKLDLMDGVWGFPTVRLPDRKGERIVYMALYERPKPGVILVNGQGRRFVDETLPYEETWHRLYDNDSADARTVPCWLVLDQRAKNRFAFFKIPPLVPFPRRWFTAGDMIKAPTIESLAEAAGMPAVQLRATVTRYNEMSRRGEDEDFGKGRTAFARYFGDSSSINPNMYPLEKGPFYATRVYPGDIGTKGGLLTDEHARVIRADGSVIDGLYAAGNCSSSVMSYGYPGPGTTISAAMVSGYIAGSHSASGAA